MKVEILFPEICNLSGDLMNIRYLKQSCPELEVTETYLKSRPRFLDGDIALVYMGTATEHGMELAAAALRPVREEILRRLDAGQLMLLTGNALDVFSEYAADDQGWRMEGLGILPGHAEYHMMDRHNSFYLGKFGDMDIVGFKSLFGHTYGFPAGEELFHTVKGIGRNEDTAEEGWHRKNLMATYLTGPLLVLNPPFTSCLLHLMGAPSERPAFEEAAMEAYRIRVAEFGEEGRDYRY